MSIGKDSLYYVPARIIPALLGFVGLSIYTRAFTPGEYGNYALIAATVTMFSVFSYIWLNNSNLRFYSVYKNQDKLGQFFTTSLFSIVASLALSLAAIVIVAKLNLISDVLVNYTPYILCLLISTSFTQTLITILRSDRKAKDISVFLCISALSSLAIALTLIFVFHMGIVSIVLGQFISDSMISCMIFLKSGFFRHVRLRYLSADTFKELFRYGSPFILLSLSSWALLMSNRFIIDHYWGEAFVGIYSAASQLGTLPIDLISSMLIMAAFPVIIDNWEKNGDDSTSVLVSSVVRYYMFITIPMLFGLFMLSSDVASLIGDRYAMGSAIIPWVSLASVCAGINMYTDMGLQLKKKTHYISAIMIFTAIVNIAANLLLVPSYGFYGSAVSSALSQALFMLLTWAVSWRYLPWRFPVNTFAKCVAASALMCLALALMKYALPGSIFTLGALVASGCAIYFIAMYAMGEMREELGVLAKRLQPVL
jgi:O-antigen/teichoic acid export membrane protein